MSLRHPPRQPDRDVRMHDPPAQAPHPYSHGLINGTSTLPSTPAANHSNPIVSPTTQTTAAASVNGAITPASPMIRKLNEANEQTWLLIGRVAEQMGDLDHALSAYENALRHNPTSLSGLTQVAGIARIKENYSKAIEFFQKVLTLQEDNGEVWSALGHCYLMQDDLQRAYSAYQQALYLLPNPKEDPKLWYGIGILYDRYGSLDHAEEAFSSVLRMDKDFDKANEILFRLGIIYKQQSKYEESLGCFDRILRNPPSPLAHADIWFQIGHVYEQQKDLVRAKDAYERVVQDNPGHAKVLQQLGWLYHQDGSTFQNQDLAIQYLTKSLEADSSDAQSWYLLGRAYMAGQKYNKAYEAYQQAVYRDGRNPTFWCSIGVLYFQINQFRDALDAYSRAIRINPYISEVWFDLGSLYESCNNQISDAIDAYARASELDPSNPVISQRLQLLKTAQATGGQLPAAPGPQDVHPTAYANSVVPPPGLTGPPLLLQSGARPTFRADSRGAPNEISLPPPSQLPGGRSSPPFRGGPPPPVILDESRHLPSHTPLAPMEVDRPPTHSREYSNSGPGREGSTRGPMSHHNLLLHHPVPQPQTPEDTRNGAHSESYFTRRPPSRSVSPAHPSRAGSPPPFRTTYPPPSSRQQPVGPAQPSNAATPRRSPRDAPRYANGFPADEERSNGAPNGQRRPPRYFNGTPMDEDPPARPSATPTVQRRSPPARYTNGFPAEQDARERRPPPPPDSREWERERGDRDQRRPRHSEEYPPPASLYPARSPAPGSHRGPSPPEPSPRSGHPNRYWDNKPVYPPSTVPHHSARSSPPPPPEHELAARRYDPRYDAPREHREHREYDDRSEPHSHAASPEFSRRDGPPPRNPPHLITTSGRRSESPHPSSSSAGPRRRASSNLKEPELPANGQQQLNPAKKRKRKSERAPGSLAGDDEGSMAGPASYRGLHSQSKGPTSPEPVSSNGSAVSSSNKPSPTNATARPPSRVVDDDYDAPEVADALMGLASYRPPEASSQSGDGASHSHSPTISSGSRHSDPSPRPPPIHRDSVSSTRSHASPTSQSAPLKRPLSPGPDDLSDNKRSRMDMLKRRPSSPSAPGRRTPLPSTRPSPIPFRTQPASHSPEARHDPYPPSPPLPALPPHPRPIGAGLSSHGSNGQGSGIALPPIATLSPTSTAPSPVALDRERERERERDERMQVDSRRSISPPSRSPPKHSPPKHSPSPPSGVEKKESA